MNSKSMKKRISKTTLQNHGKRKGTTQENLKKADDAQKLDVHKTL